jgi:hypothetical protein
LFPLIAKATEPAALCNFHRAVLYWVLTHPTGASTWHHGPRGIMALLRPDYGHPVSRRQARPTCKAPLRARSPTPTAGVWITGAHLFPIQAKEDPARSAAR